MKKNISMATFVVLAFAIFTSCEKQETTQTKTEATQQPATASARAAATWCQCLKLIRNCTGLPANTKSVSAKDYGTVLTANGYSSSSTPSNGAIVIFDKNYGGGINTTHGHIGYIVDWSLVAATKTTSAYYKIKIKSANWTGNNLFTECDCNNVENSGFLSVNTTTKKSNIKYWKK